MANVGTITLTAASGIVSADVVTATGTAAFANMNVGSKTVTFSGYTLGGSAAGNYTLIAQPASVTADITAKSITLTPSGALTLTPLGGETSGQISLSGSGLVGSDTVTVNMTLPSDLTASNNTGKANGETTITITITYSIATEVTTPACNHALSITSTNYTLSSSPTATVTVYDGQAVDRQIPVTQANVLAFNTYACTTNALKRHYKQTTDITLPTL